MESSFQTISTVFKRPSALFAVLLAWCLLLWGSALQAQQGRPDTVQLNTDVPMTYVVKRGDTLWDISDMYLKEPWRWPELWDNNTQIDNPHLIYPGDVLALRWENGRPRLGLASRGDVKLSPNLRSESLNSTIPPIPRDQIDAFLRNNRVVDPLEFDKAAYIIAGDAGRLISSLGDRIYGRGPIDATDRTFGVLRRGEFIVDPISQEVLGLKAEDIGTASLLASSDTEFSDADVKEFEITRVTEEVRIGDRLLPTEEGILAAYFQPHPPSSEVKDGYMVAVDGGVTQIGAMDIVTLNKGSREALAVGDVLAIHQTGEIVLDPILNEPVVLPDVRAGMLMVFAVYDKASFALVLKASRPLAVGDKIKNP